MESFNLLSSAMAQGDAMSALMQLSMAGMGSRCIIHMVKRGSVFNGFVADRREPWSRIVMVSCRTPLVGRFAVFIFDTLEECIHDPCHA